MTESKTLRIIFFGTPEFAEASLRAIYEAGYTVVAVVTAPDKAAGRGQKPRFSAVKQAAISLGLPLLQPTNLKSPEFIEELRSYKADLQVVIAFRMLPEVVWNMPILGTFNLHASYLPAYRGAAPINRAIMNGETETGLSSFFLKHEIDTGGILLQKKVPILAEDNAGSLHDKLMLIGSQLVLDSLHLINSGIYETKPQPVGEFPLAPKIFTEDCLINWHLNAMTIHNQVRGLAPYPAAFTEFRGKKMKVFQTKPLEETAISPGKFEIRGKNQLFVHCGDCLIELLDVQLEGKKRMSVRDFLNGLQSVPE